MSLLLIKLEKLNKNLIRELNKRKLLVTFSIFIKLLRLYIKYKKYKKYYKYIHIL